MSLMAFKIDLTNEPLYEITANFARFVADPSKADTGVWKKGSRRVANFCFGHESLSLNRTNCGSEQLSGSYFTAEKSIPAGSRSAGGGGTTSDFSHFYQ